MKTSPASEVVSVFPSITLVEEILHYMIGHSIPLRNNSSPNSSIAKVRASPPAIRRILASAVKNALREVASHSESQ